MAVAVPASGVRVERLLRMRLCSARARTLADFYRAALGFREVGVEQLTAAQSEDLFGLSGRALRVTLELGGERLAMVQFDHPGRAYPSGTDASDRVFQHFALVVDDMPAAMTQLASTPGWTAISRDGPQQLPASSGAVTAFKFRDPEGHPLELLAFPRNHVPVRWRQAHGRGPFLGIDHSAISVADSARSIAFYETLGLSVSNQSINDDLAQARLDGLTHPVAEVTALTPELAPPHLELLCYRGANPSAPLDLHANDVAATCLVFQADVRSPRPAKGRSPVQRLVDPDGHHLAIEWPGP